jgi:hypothetical protein
MFNDTIEYNSSCFYTSKDLIHVFWCYRAKTHHVYASGTRSNTPSSTRSGTRSNTTSNTTSCTKTKGDLVVLVLATNDGRIGNVGFVHAFHLQLLNFRQLSFSCSRGRLLVRFVSTVRISFNVNCRI